MNTGGIELSENIKKLSRDILEWKTKYKNIYYVTLSGNEYIFRILTKGEFLSLYFIQAHISSEAEDVLLEKCILFPKDNSFDQLLAGDVNYLITSILSLSGFSDFDSITADLDKERANIQLLDNQIVLMICKAFPHITPSDVDNFDYQTILHHISLAEILLGTRLEISKKDEPNKINFNEENKKQGFPGAIPNKRTGPGSTIPRR